MRRWAVILMLLGAGGVACGGLNYLHRRQHLRQSEMWLAAARVVAARAGGNSNSPVPMPLGRDDASCLICQTLHAPFAAVGAAPAVAGPVLLMAAIVLRPVVVEPVRISLHIDSRGPPVG